MWRASVRKRAQARIESNWETPKTYKCIRIVSREDIELTYPLIAAYITKPELALSVEHFILDQGSWPNDRGGYNWPAVPSAVRPVREDSHKAIEDHVRALGLGNFTTRRMLCALDWKKRFLRGEWKETDDASKSYNVYNTEYGSVASIVLLSLCKNIVTLHLGSTHWSLIGEYMMSSNYGLIPQPALQKLKSVEHGYWANGYSGTYVSFQFLDWFRCFHRLPEIQSVTIAGVMDWQSDRKLFPPGVSNVTKLYINHSHIYGLMLGTIIRMHKGLQELLISLGGMNEAHGTMQSVYPKTLGKSLLTQKDTLRVLDLDMDEAYNEHIGQDGVVVEREDDTADEFHDIPGSEGEVLAKEYDEWFDYDEEISNDNPLWVEELPNTRPYHLTIGSMHDFTALKRLSIGIIFFMGPNKRHYTGPNSWTESSVPPFRLATAPPFRLVDALPPNLEYLCLRGYYKGENSDIDDHVNELLEKRTDRFPHLSEIQGIDIAVPGLDVKYGRERPGRSRQHDESSDTESEIEYIQHPELGFDWVEA